MSEYNPSVAIAGAGIGGLIAALALLKRGIDVNVYEQSPVLGEIGAGFQVSANGTRVLYHLDLGDEIEKICWSPSGKEIRIWNTGQTWPLFDLGTESVSRYGFPYMMFHRADLHEVLVKAVRKLKPDAIHLNRSCVGTYTNDDKAVLKFSDGGEASADVAVGADGIHSAVRKSLFGDDKPNFTGIMAWRGVIDIRDLPEGLLRPVGTNWVGPGGHVVHYYLRGGKLVNFFGAQERDDWQVESWVAEGSREECVSDFADWHEVVRTLAANIEKPLKWALMDREPIENWTDERVTLLGDACHPMLPFLAQGAVMAMEDGLMLARALDEVSDIVEALQRYQTARIDRTTRAVRGSTENAKRFHNSRLADPEVAKKYVDEQWDKDEIASRYDWLFTYDAILASI